MNYKEIAIELKEAKALIDSPEKWTKGKYGRDAYGDCVSTSEWGVNPPACMCSVGAIHMVQRSKNGSILVGRAAFGDSAALLGQVAGMSIEQYNDKHSHEKVMAVWDKAIAKAEELAKGEEK